MPGFSDQTKVTSTEVVLLAIRPGSTDSPIRIRLDTPEDQAALSTHVDALLGLPGVEWVKVETKEEVKLREKMTSNLLPCEIAHEDGAAVGDMPIAGKHHHDDELAKTCWELSGRPCSFCDSGAPTYTTEPLR